MQRRFRGTLNQCPLPDYRLAGNVTARKFALTYANVSFAAIYNHITTASCKGLYIVASKGFDIHVYVNFDLPISVVQLICDGVTPTLKTYGKGWETFLMTQCDNVVSNIPKYNLKLVYHKMLGAANEIEAIDLLAVADPGAVIKKGTEIRANVANYILRNTIFKL